MLTFDDATADVQPPGLPSKQGPMESLLALVFAKDVATVKAYLPEGLKAQAARRSPVEQQLFFEGLRFAENARVQGGRIERRGKPNKPEIRLDSDRLSGKVVCDKERIAGDRADIECKGRASTSKEDRPFRVRMVAQQGRWRVSGFEVVGAGEGTWSQLEDGQIFERLDASQRQANESRAIMDLRSLISAQAYVTSINGGFYLSPECLEALEACVSGYAGPPAMEPPFSWVIPRNGYRFTFKAGSRPSSQELRKAKASASSLASFALVAVPEMPGKSGTRGFCGDASGVICETPDGSPPAVRNGSCVLPCSVLR
jgi:hypothetical protein